MPVLQFKGKTAIECYHHTVPHHTLEFDGKLSALGKGEKAGLDGNLIIEEDNLTQPQFKEWVGEKVHSCLEIIPSNWCRSGRLHFFVDFFRAIGMGIR